MSKIDTTGFTIADGRGRDTLVVRQRFVKPRDMPDIIEIDAGSFEHPWDEQTYIDHFKTRGRNCIGRVAEYHGNIVGFVVYRTGRSSIELLRLAVHPGEKFARRGIGTQLINGLTTLLTSDCRRITLHVRESNLAAQLFYRRMGFRANEDSVIKGHYKDTGEDAYRLIYTLGA